eukprot:3072917-Prymnesium_polylepis.1
MLLAVTSASTCFDAKLKVWEKDLYLVVVFAITANEPERSLYTSSSCQHTQGCKSCFQSGMHIRECKGRSSSPSGGT